MDLKNLGKKMKVGPKNVLFKKVFGSKEVWTKKILVRKN